MNTLDKININELCYKCAEYVYSYIEESERNEYLTYKKNLGDLFQEYEGELLDMIEDLEEIEFDFDKVEDMDMFDNIILKGIDEAVEMLESN